MTVQNNMGMNVAHETPPAMRMRGMSMQNGMGGGDEVREKLEYHAKMKRYKAKHDKAVETFKTLTGETVETREGAVKALAWIMKNKSYTQAAEAIMAASDFCWACNEESAEKEVKEEVDTLSGLMRG
jgi:hypothetical protein